MTSKNKVNNAKKRSSASKNPQNITMTMKENSKKAKELEEMSVYILDTDYENNTNTVIKYYKKFDQTKIDALLEEAFESLKTDEKEKLGFFKGDHQFIPYVLFLVAVRMTNLNDSVPKSLKEQIPLFLEMRKTGLYDRIFNEVLSPNEVEKVMERLIQFQALVEQVGIVTAEVQEQLGSTIKNEEIFNSINFSEQEKNKQPIHPLVNPASVN